MLTGAEHDQFERDGFLVCPAIHDVATMDRIRREINAVLATTGHASSPSAHRHLDSRVIHDLVAQPAIVDRMATLIGPDPLLWNTRLFDKASGEGPVPWHQDIAFWPLEPTLCVSEWIAIDRSDTGNGCLELLPGSHRSSIPDISSKDIGRFRQQVDLDVVDISGKVSIELDPGEFLLFDRWMLHGSPGNHSDRRRLGLAARIIPTSVKVDFGRMKPNFPELAAQLVRGEDIEGLNRLVPRPR